MTTQEKIKEIREKCIAANPSILDLKIGCLAKLGREVCHVEEWTNPEETYLVRRICEINAPKYVRIPDDVKVKIIGRPIHLADVLLVINYRNFVVKDGWVYLGSAMQTKFWNLKKDSLEEQSEPTINFIHRLLENALSTL